MSEKETLNVELDSEDPAEQDLWLALEGLPRETPSADLRRSFYRDLERATTPRWSERLQRVLGLSSRRGWLTAAASILVGIGVGQMRGESGGIEPVRLAALEENIAFLNRELILDRMQDSKASQRLRGVIDAEIFVQDDFEIVRALLIRATEDRVQSVRSAAINALGASLTSAALSQELMNLLENAESPLVQLALVDLVLRNGNDVQMEYLLHLADIEKLHPDLIRHIKNSLGRETA